MQYNIDFYASVIIISLVALTVFFIWLKLNLKRIQVKCIRLKDENRRIRNKMKVITAGALGVGEKINKLQSDFRTISAKIKPNSCTFNDNVNIYAQAKVIAAKGGSISDIMYSCGLSKAEAELIIASINKFK